MNALLSSRLAHFTATVPRARALLTLMGAEGLVRFDAAPYALIAEALRLEEEGAARARSSLEEEA